MACATPVATTTGGFLPEVAGGAATLVGPGDDNRLGRRHRQAGHRPGPPAPTPPPVAWPGRPRLHLVTLCRADRGRLLPAPSATRPGPAAPGPWRAGSRLEALGQPQLLSLHVGLERGRSRPATAARSAALTPGRSPISRRAATSRGRPGAAGRAGRGAPQPGELLLGELVGLAQAARGSAPAHGSRPGT